MLLQGLVPCLASFGVGVVLRQSICTEVDGITVRRLATHVTLPALILQVCGSVSRNGTLVSLPTLAFVAVAYSLAVLLPGIVTWARTRYLHPKERGVLAGVSFGSSMELFAVPLVALCLGQEALQMALVCSFINFIATHLVALLYFSTAGPAFPKDFKHTDGGVYNGEWKGALKDGFGVYKYPSGAKYEGEWLDGTKEGRGVYTFAKGGIYEGEWRDGKMEGVGVRTYSSGKVVSGFWEGGKLIKPFDESQCALVVANANEAAFVARKVFVGAIEMDEMLRRILMQPAMWACLVGAALIASGSQMTPGIDYVTQQLSKSHASIAFVSLGLLFDPQEIEKRQMNSITQVLATRTLPGLILYLAAACLLEPITGGIITSNTLCALALATVSPLSSTSLEMTHVFRLNENLVAAMTRYSTYVSASCACLLLLGAGYAQATQSNVPMLSSIAAVAILIWFMTAYWSIDKTNSQEPDFYKRTVKMVYRGPSQEGGGSVTASALPPSSSRAGMNNKKKMYSLFGQRRSRIIIPVMRQQHRGMICKPSMAMADGPRLRF